MRLHLDSPLEQLAGIGPRRAAILKARGLSRVGDLLFALPSRYLDWREVKAIHELQPGTVVTIAGRLSALSDRPMRGSRWRRLLSGWLQDGQGGRIRVVWFNAPRYLRERFGAAQMVMVQGKVSRAADGHLEILHPEVHLVGQEPSPGIQPSYRIGEYVGQRLARTAIETALDSADEVSAALPEEFRARLGLLSTQQALRVLHQPPPDANLEELQTGATPAHKALAIDELFAFETALLMDRRQTLRQPGIAFGGNDPITGRFVEGLPFEMTASQRRAIDEIATDMARDWQMNRLLMGDVGSGKTVVALWAALRAVEHGYQAAVMAPTELLAEQHYATFEKLCGSLGIKAAVLSGNLTGARRRQVLAWLASGEPGVAFGTHALIQRTVEIPRLGLAVIDEQHRFGVFDRARLKALGPSADMLLLSATPIPRSLARVLLSNLEVTTLEQPPAGRPPVTTRLVEEGQLDRVWDTVRDEVAQGHRAYCILPLIESEEQQEMAVLTAADQLRKGPLAGLQIGVMHGRLGGTQKDSVMRDFRSGLLEVLVSTTVVEVGIDVPAATVMVIIDAQRYGLAQLHQLRGRIGRGQAPGYCWLAAPAGLDPAARKRLQVLVEKTSGPEIAQADLELRGPGDLFGARQAGPLPLRFAHWMRDLNAIVQVHDLAKEWLERHPDLAGPESCGVRLALSRLLDPEEAVFGAG